MAGERTDLSALLAAPARHVVPGHVPPAGPVRWSFDAGLPDPVTFPTADLARLIGSVLAEDPTTALQYGGARDRTISAGDAGLRDRLARRGDGIGGAVAHRDQVMLTAGATQGITLVLEAFVDPGDIVAVEAPTWNAVLGALSRRRAEPLALPMDDDGIVVEALEERLADLAASGRRLKLLYTIANFNTPTGVCLSMPRRRRLVELAREHGFLILEDDVYGLLRYEGAHLPSLLSIDDAGLVVQVNSFSKTVAPGVRLGWVTGSEQVIDTLVGVRGDLGVSPLLARTLVRYLDEGCFESHLAEVLALYRTKRDLAAAALSARCGSLVHWRHPEGGFFLWLELDDAVDAAAVATRALEGGVACRPGERFFGDANQDQGRQFLRLAFPAVPLKELDAAIAVLGDAVTAAVRDAGART